MGMGGEQDTLPVVCNLIGCRLPWCEVSFGKERLDLEGACSQFGSLHRDLHLFPWGPTFVYYASIPALHKTTFRGFTC